MVALNKVFALLLTCGAALAAPLGGSADSTAADVAVNEMALEARPNHNPSAARITRGNDFRTMVLTMGFTQIPAETARQLSEHGYEVLRQTIETKFMTWMNTQNEAMRNYWHALIQGQKGYIQSAAREQFGVVQYQLIIALDDTNEFTLGQWIISPLAAYLQNARVNVVQTSGNIPSSVMEMQVEGRAVGPSRGHPGPSRCARIPDVSVWNFVNNNPPAPFNGGAYNWCY